VSIRAVGLRLVHIDKPAPAVRLCIMPPFPPIAAKLLAMLGRATVDIKRFAGVISSASQHAPLPFVAARSRKTRTPSGSCWDGWDCIDLLDHERDVFGMTTPRLAAC
jgi:hypothetical protein